MAANVRHRYQRECLDPADGHGAILHQPRSCTTSRLRCSSSRLNAFTAAASAPALSGASTKPRAWARLRISDARRERRGVLVLPLTFGYANATTWTPPSRGLGAAHQCMSRKLAQSITTNIVAIATAIETLSRALRMGALFCSGRQVPVTPGNYSTAVKIFCDGNLDETITRAPRLW